MKHLKTALFMVVGITVISIVVISAMTGIVKMAQNLTDTEPKAEPESIETPIVELTFTEDSVLFIPYRVYIITTEDETFAWDGDYVEIVRTDDDENKISYKKDEDGDIYNKVIHLNKDGVKTYSQEYAEMYNQSLKLKQTD